MPKERRMKMKRMKMLCGLLACVMVFGTILTGCDAQNENGGNNAPTVAVSEEPKDPYAVPEGEVSEQTVLPDKDHVKYLGRAVYEQDSLWMSLSGTGAEFEFYGTDVTVTLLGDSTAVKLGAGTVNRARVAVYADGERVVDTMMDTFNKPITVLTGAEEGWHTIRVVKLSEAENSSLGIGSITVVGKGEVRPTEAKKYYIEFIGDSITCGYGVDDEVKENHFSTTTEDATKTYAYQTAQLLDADYSLVSFSGFGVYSGYTSDGNRNETSLVPPYYDKVGFSWGAAYKGIKPQDMDYTFDRQPDVVVINLGTNDSSYVGSDKGKKAEFEAEYVAFLKAVREKNPDAHILCTLGIMGDSLYSCVENAVSAYTAETGDANVSSMKFAVQSASDGYAADWHPTYATHKKAAEKLVEDIKLLLK